MVCDLVFLSISSAPIFDGFSDILYISVYLNVIIPIFSPSYMHIFYLFVLNKS